MRGRVRLAARGRRAPSRSPGAPAARGASRPFGARCPAAAVVRVLTQPKQFLLVKKFAAAVVDVDVAEFLIRHGPNLTSVEN